MDLLKTLKSEKKGGQSQIGAGQICFAQVLSSMDAIGTHEIFDLRQVRFAVIYPAF